MGDRDSEEDGVLIDQALLRIFEAEDELALVADEIQRLYEHHQHKDTDKDLEDQPQGDQPQGDQPMDYQGDMPMDAPIDDNEAQEIGASPTPSLIGGSNISIPPERQL